MTDNAHDGHRQRLRERFLEGDAEAYSDTELLELLLTYAIPRKDVRPLAQALLHAFSSLSGVLSATREALGTVDGVGPTSVVLLKAVDAARSQVAPAAVSNVSAAQSLASQISFFGPPTEVLDQAHLQPATERSEGKASPQRKLQVSRSRLLEFSRLSQILSLVYQNREQAKISRALLIEETGLPDSQIESLVSVAVAMGLMQSGNQTLTPVGLLVAEHDVFVEQQGTLEWCHYQGAGTYRNLIWFDAFNRLLPEEPAMTQLAWQERLEEELRSKFAEETVRRHVSREIDFIIDAYFEGNFRRLELLQRAPDGRLFTRRYVRFEPLVLCAMVYDFCLAQGATVTQVDDMAVAPGSPAVVFGLDATTFRAQIEALHDLGWLRYETTHNLDQIRLKPGLSSIEFLTAYYEGREPGAAHPV